MSYEAEIELQRADDRAWRAEVREHLATCQREIALCRVCSDEFGLTPYT